MTKSKLKSPVLDRSVTPKLTGRNKVLTKITYAILYVMLLSPLLSYFSLGILGWRSISFLFEIIFVVYGVCFWVIRRKTVVIPNFAKLAFIWAIYYSVWELINGNLGKTGILAAFLKNAHFSVFFALLIIYNTRFDNLFISRTIKVFKLTVIISVIVSILQVFDPSFLDATKSWSWLSEIDSTNLYTIRRHSIFGYIDLNAIGLSFMPIVAVLSGWLLQRRKHVLSYLIMGTTVALLTNTRYVMIAGVMTFTVLLLNSKNKAIGSIKSVIVLLGALLLGRYLIEYLGYDIQEWFSTRVFRENSIQDSERYASYIVFGQFFPQYWLYGNGNIQAEEIVRASLPLGTPFIHVGYLTYLVAYGVFGCFFLYGFWFLLVKRLWRTARLTMNYGSLLAFSIFLMSFVTMTEASIFYYGLLFALVFDKYIRDNHVGSSAKHLNTVSKY